MSFGSTQAVAKFFDQVQAAIVRHLNFEVVKAVIIASPGFVKDQFFEYMMKVCFFMLIFLHILHRFVAVHWNT